MLSHRFAGFVLHPVGLDQDPHSRADPFSERISRVEPQKREQGGKPGRNGVVVRRGPYNRLSGTQDTDSQRRRHCCCSSPVRVWVRERSHAVSARDATATASRQPLTSSTAPTRQCPARYSLAQRNHIQRERRVLFRSIALCR